MLGRFEAPTVEICGFALGPTRLDARLLAGGELIWECRGCCRDDRKGYWCCGRVEVRELWRRTAEAFRSGWWACGFDGVFGLLRLRIGMSVRHQRVRAEAAILYLLF